MTVDDNQLLSGALELPDVVEVTYALTFEDGRPVKFGDGKWHSLCGVIECADGAFRPITAFREFKRR